MTTSVSVSKTGAKRVRLFRFIYDNVIPKFYDPVCEVFKRRTGLSKEQIVDALGLKPNDRVIVFCCGTGQEFPFIQDRIGPGGEILGVDWSEGMLERARQRIVDNGWANVKVVNGDVTALPEEVVAGSRYNAGIITGGLSFIEEPGRVVHALKNAVQPDGRMAMGDWCSFSGFKSILNPLLLLGTLIYGITRRNLADSRSFAEKSSNLLNEAAVEWRLGGCYYIVSGAA